MADEALRFEPRIEPETYRIPKCPKRPTCSKRLAEYHASLPAARGVAPASSDAPRALRLLRRKTDLLLSESLLAYGRGGL